MVDPRRAYASLSELMQLFEGEPLGGASGQFRDVDFDIYRRGADGVTLGVALMLGGGLFAAAAAAAGTRQGDMGHFVRVWLSSPLGVDLLVQSRDEEDEREDGLLRYFHVDAANPAHAVRRLSGPLEAALLALRERYRIQMTDDALEFGPLTGRPSEAVADLVRAIDALAAHCDASRRREADPDLGADAAFCYFCGLAVRRGTEVCPGCGEKLDEEAEDCG